MRVFGVKEENVQIFRVERGLNVRTSRKNNLFARASVGSRFN